MSRISKHLHSILAAVSLLAGCAGATELVDSDLGEEEAPALAQVVLFATFNSTSVLPNRPDRPIGTTDWGMDFEAEVRCPRGGTVGLGASLTVSGQGDRADYRLRQIHEGCAGAATGRQFSVSGGTPVLATVSVAHAANGSVAWTGTAEGDVVWTTSGRSGRCFFRLEFAGATDSDPSSTVDLAGTMCGHVLDDSVPLAID